MQYSTDEVAAMVKQRQNEGVAFNNVALSRIKLTNSLEAAVAEGREDEADFCREQLAKVRERQRDKQLLTPCIETFVLRAWLT